MESLIWSFMVCKILCGLVWLSIVYYVNVFPCKISNGLVWLYMVLYGRTQLCTIFVLVFWKLLFKKKFKKTLWSVIGYLTGIKQGNSSSLYYVDMFKDDWCTKSFDIFTTWNHKADMLGRLSQTWKKLVCFHDPNSRFSIISAQYPSKNEQFRHSSLINDRLLLWNWQNILDFII